MSLKRRLRNLEKDHSVDEADVVYFRTFYEDEDGSVSDHNAISRAVIIWGKLGGGHVHKDQGETFDEFEERVGSYAKMTFHVAQAVEEIVFYPARRPTVRGPDGAVRAGTGNQRPREAH